MSDLFLLRNSEILDLFEIKINDYEGYLCFHGSKNFDKDLIFQNKVYLYLPSEISNLEYSSDAKQNRPTLIISNINNFITNFIKDRDDLLGKRFYRKKILAKDLDPINFGGEAKNTLGGSSFRSFIASDTYIIHRKNYETKEKVEFSLANVLDLEGMTIPNRKVYSDFCSWQYRGCGCNYGKIYGYDGPTIESNVTAYTSLSEINTEDPNNILTSNLLVWLRPEGINTSDEVSMVRIGPRGPEETLKFAKVSSWTNEGNAGVNPDFSSTNPKKIEGNTNSKGYYSNAGRMNNQAGVYFSASFDGGLTFCNPVVDKMLINYNFSSTDITIFYVAEMVNLKYKEGTNVWTSVGDKKGGVVRGGLTWGTNNNGWLGWRTAQRDAVSYVHRYNSCSLNGVLISDGPGDARNYINKPFIYGLVYPKTNSNNTKLYSNGANLYNSKISTGGTPTSLRVNYDYCNGGIYAQSSEIVIYEVIVYNKILDDEIVNKINSYLGSKYNISVPKQFTRTVYKTGSSFFNSYDGNLGVPIADENNKVFLKSYAENLDALRSSESYNILSMQYKTGYNPDYNYSQGDFVKIDTNIDFDFNEKSMIQNNDFPSRFFVCVDPNGSLNKHPLNYTNVWVEDKCSRNLNGCSLRFNDPKVNIPFGGFPGTVSYDYKLPSS